MPSSRIARLLSTALLASALPTFGAAAATAGEAPGPLVVRFEEGSSEAERAHDLEARGLVVVDRLPGSDHALVQERPGTVRSAGLVDDSVVELAPLVTHQAFAAAPNDPAYRFQWHLPAIDATSAWDVTTGVGTIVAVVDTGVASADRGAHLRAPDLAGTAFAPGWDFVDGDPFPDDENGHGTHVAGTIAQTTGNGIGAAGVAPGATIMPIRVLDARGVGSDWNIAQGIRFAADHGADVVNLSLGSTTPSSVVTAAVAHALGLGVTVVAAAGNDGTARVSYPAADEGVLAVGAIRMDRTRPAYANHGPGLDLVAPGGDLSVDQDGNGYGDGILQQTTKAGPDRFCLCFLQGTSMATPQVAAVAALVVSRGVDDPRDVAAVLRASAVDLGAPGRDDEFGDGLVQAGAAARAELPDPARRSADPDRVTAGTTPVAEKAAPQPEEGATATRGIEHACPERTTPAPAFTDIGASVHAASIGCVAWWRIAEGRTATSFDPDRGVTRGQLASFVARLLEVTGAELPADPPDAFADDASSPHGRRIDQLAALGIVRGRLDGTYGPEDVVTRAEMATFLLRAHDHVAGAPLPAGPDRFRDDDTSPHRSSIDAIAAAGLAGGTGATTFAPGAPVLRGQMATFLARTLDALVEGGMSAA